jgi:hypothetical protein
VLTIVPEALVRVAGRRWVSAANAGGNAPRQAKGVEHVFDACKSLRVLFGHGECVSQCGGRGGLVVVS